jgi:hypothetical protein
VVEREELSRALAGIPAAPDAVLGEALLGTGLPRGCEWRDHGRGHCAYIEEQEGEAIHDDSRFPIESNFENPSAYSRGCRLVEFVLRDGNDPGFGTGDVAMLVLVGGAERTAGEYDALLGKAGLAMTRVIPTTTSASIIEAEIAAR